MALDGLFLAQIPRPGILIQNLGAKRHSRAGLTATNKTKVRLTDAFVEIAEVAARGGVRVSALIRGWMLQGSASEQGVSLRDRIEHLAAAG